MMCQRELVQDTWRLVIERHVRGIVSGRLFVVTQVLRNITQSFEGARGFGGERAGPGQISLCSRQIAPTLIGFTVSDGRACYRSSARWRR